MARNTRAKKQPEAHKIDVTEFFAALRDLEKVKGIPMDYMLERMKQALTNAYRKDREDRRDVPAENVVVDISEQNGITMFQVKTVVEVLEDTALEIHIDTARNMNPNVQVGDTITIPVAVEKLSRIAAQTAKQVVIQGIREAERGMAYESYSNKAQELLTGTVLRIDPSGDMIVTVGSGNEKHNAVLRTGEQIPGESYKEGDKIRVYVLVARLGARSTNVYVSRTHPNLVRRLFELETPEIAEGQVEIRNIAREAGSRSKMAVRATMEGVDPVGACVGPRGGRVGAVVEELHGEKIDIVVWSEDPCEYVKAALSPADVVRVELVSGQKACRVVVPDDQLSLAIGKEGQNARLVARLTGYKIDIKPASQAEPEEVEID